MRFPRRTASSQICRLSPDRAITLLLLLLLLLQAFIPETRRSIFAASSLPTLHMDLLMQNSSADLELTLARFNMHNIYTMYERVDSSPPYLKSAMQSDDVVSF
jgi:hypothetical protein